MATRSENRFAGAVISAVKALREAIRYDIMSLKIRSYITESEQLAIAFLLAVFALGLVKKYLIK